MSKELDKLLEQLIKLHPKYIDLSLNRILKLLQKLDNPHLKLPPVIHIAGTNGKGSVLSYILNILKENSYKIHAYTSPHLSKFNERIVISNNIISTAKLIKTLKNIKKINGKQPITFFEITTAAAFYLFSKERADFVILETGLGGRLDATNVITNSLINIITPIGIDHQEFLGKKIINIANEKLGIIKQNSVVIFSKQKKIVDSHIKKKLFKKKNEKLFFNQNYKIIYQNNNLFKLKYKKKLFNFKNPKLNGEHQIENASTAITAALYLKEIGYNIEKKNIDKAMLNTKWPGRLEKTKKNNVIFYLDGAHNIDGANAILKFFKKKDIKVWLIFGMLNNKNIYNFLKILKPILLGVICIPIPNEKNTYKNEEMIKVCKKLKILSFKKNNFSCAKNFLLKEINPKVILISGSLYLIGKIRNRLL